VREDEQEFIVIEFLLDAPDLGNRDAFSALDEGEGYHLLSAGRKRLSENRKCLVELRSHLGDVPVFTSIGRRHRDGLPQSPFGDKILVFRESAQMNSDFLG